MSSITAADLKLGGRLVAAADAIGAGHLRRAAGIFAEIADDLNVEAENCDGLMSDEVELPAQPIEQSEEPTMAAKGQPADLQMCARNVHAFGQPDPVSGWSKCAVCGMVSVVGQNQGPYDMSARSA